MMIIEADRLKKTFGAFTAVDEISFGVAEGSVYGILGANGAGKTTTIRMMCGLLIPTSGKLIVGGMDAIKQAESIRKIIGYMSQQFSLYMDLTVKENLEFYGGLYGLRGDKLRNAINKAIEDLELDRFRNERAANLPLGFKQRLALASASLHKPKILFLDEPTSGVDPLTRMKFWSYVRTLVNEFSITAIVSTHFLNEAEYCDSIMLMHEGKIAVDGAPAQIKKKVSEEISIYEVSTKDNIEKIYALLNYNYVLDIYSWGRKYRVTVLKNAVKDLNILLEDFNKYIEISGMIEIKPTLEDVFIRYYRL